MDQFRKKIDVQDFQNLCEYICYQLRPSESRELDRETLYFAIYWKICDLTGQKLSLPLGAAKIPEYRSKIQDSLILAGNQIFDAPQIADRVINFFVESLPDYRNNISEISVPVSLKS